MPRSRAPRHRHHPTACRRASQRLLCSDLVQLRWHEESGAREEIAILEDFNPAGASLFTGVPVPPGSPVTLGARGHNASGVVRHSSRVPNGYLVGVEFKAGCHFTPDHLLDVARLDFSPEV